MNQTSLLARRSLLVLGAGVALLGSCGPLLFDNRQLPSDESLLQNFREKRALFERILSMARAETRLVRIAPGFVWLTDTLSPTNDQRAQVLTDKRWDEYRRLFVAAHIRDGIVIRDGGILFLAAGMGLAVSGSAKGYYWSVGAPPGPLFEDLDALPKGLPADFEGYRRIDDEWCLEIDWT